VSVLYAYEQGDFVGLDQANIGPIPRTTSGTVEIQLRDRGSNRVTNPVRAAVE
jgi:hypothetical protein